MAEGSASTDHRRGDIQAYVLSQWPQWSPHARLVAPDLRHLLAYAEVLPSR